MPLIDRLEKLYGLVPWLLLSALMVTGESAWAQPASPPGDHAASPAVSADVGKPPEASTTPCSKASAWRSETRDALMNPCGSFWTCLLICVLPVVLSLGMAVRVLFTDRENYGGWAGWKGRFNAAHTFIFNLAGSVAGWMLLWAGLYRVTAEPTLSRLDWIDLFVFLLAFLGVTGHLPQFAHGLVASVGRLAEVLAKKLAG